MLRTVGKVCSSEGDVLAQKLLDLFEFGGGYSFASKVISFLAVQEIKETREAATIFRSSSFTTKMAELFLRRLHYSPLNLSSAPHQINRD